MLDPHKWYEECWLCDTDGTIEKNKQTYICPMCNGDGYSPHGHADDHHDDDIDTSDLYVN